MCVRRASPIGISGALIVVWAVVSQPTKLGVGPGTVKLPQQPETPRHARQATISIVIAIAIAVMIMIIMMPPRLVNQTQYPTASVGIGDGALWDGPHW